MKQLLDFEDKSLKSFFFSSSQLMCIMDCGFGSILEANDTAIKNLGYTRENFFLQLVEKIILQKEQQKLFLLSTANKQFAQCQTKKDVSLQSQSGKVIFVETIVSNILFRGEEARLLTMVDVTEKKRYREMLEEGVGEEISLKNKNSQLKNLAYLNFHKARKPLANILGLVNVLDQSVIADQTLTEAIEFLKESSNELDELIKRLDPQLF